MLRKLFASIRSLHAYRLLCKQKSQNRNDFCDSLIDPCLWVLSSKRGRLLSSDVFGNPSSPYILSCLSMKPISSQAGKLSRFDIGRYHLLVLLQGSTDTRGEYKSHNLILQRFCLKLYRHVLATAPKKGQTRVLVFDRDFDAQNMSLPFSKNAILRFL